MAIMHRTQILLETHQYERLTLEARKNGISLAALIRRLVEQHISSAPEPADPLDELEGIGQGDGSAIGRYHNRHLYGEKS